MMKDHLVAYFDLLGFSSVIKDENANRREKIFRLLSKLAESVGEYETQPATIGSFKTFKTRPAISAFSDNIVFSFPLDDVNISDFGWVVSYLVRQTAAIFSDAIKIGCLIRGGISVGPLHHKNNVIFGAALVEAYELESKFAHTPRVLLSGSAASMAKGHYFVKNDEDGFFALDYLLYTYSEMSNVYSEAEGLEMLDDWDAQRIQWKESIREMCDKQIAELRKAKNLAGVRNWYWLMNQLRHLPLPQA